MKKYNYEILDSAAAPENVAEFLNRNKFYIAKHKKINANELNAVQKKRGTIFSILAFDKDKCIGMVAGYPVAGQKIAKAHQLFMGTLIIDKFYVIRPSIISTLFRMAINEIRKRGYREIISKTTSANKLSFNMLRRHAFVLLDEGVDYYDCYELHNYLPAVFNFFGENNLHNEIAEQEMYNYHFLPKVDKTERFENCTFYNKNIIVQTFNLLSDSISLYIDIESSVVVGFEFGTGISMIPNSGEYYTLGNKSTDIAVIEIEYDDIFEKFDILPGENKIAPTPKNKDIKVRLLNKTFFILGDLVVNHQTDATVTLYRNEIYKLLVNKTTGSVSVFSQPSDKLLFIMPWPYYGEEYIQGAMKGRKMETSDFEVTNDSFTISEHTAHGTIKNVYELKEHAIAINSQIDHTGKEKTTTQHLYNQIWVNGFSGEHEQKPDFADYPLWMDGTTGLINSVDILTEDQHFAVTTTNNQLLVNLPSIMALSTEFDNTTINIDF